MLAVSIHAPARGATQPRRPRAHERCVFRSTPPRGGRRSCRDARQPIGRCFDPRPRAGGDRGSSAGRARAAVFRSTPPRGGRPSQSAAALVRLSRFRSTPPRGGRPRRSRPPMPAMQFRSTPPRGGRPCRCLERRRPAVSIHAPARGRPSRSARRASATFRSTPPRGGRRAASRDRARLRDVSIHAPARGATAAGDRRCAVQQLFRSTPPRGGRRRPDQRSLRLTARFDPRPREGGDLRNAAAC